MARFPLAGLLRLRRLQEDTAAGAFASANHTLRSTNAARAGAYQRLGVQSSQASGTQNLRALGAARAASTSQLAELHQTAELHARQAADAAAALVDAHRVTRSVEKLERKHRDAVMSEELRSEQLVLDEIASVGHRRGQAGR